MPRIGVFDSGIGGLTVLRALRTQLPNSDYLYLGDTARLPYGTKSPATVARYAVQAAQALVREGIDMLVVACNTASAQGLEALRTAYPQLPVMGVIQPGAEAALQATCTNRIAVIATEGTVKSGAYGAALWRCASFPPRFWSRWRKKDGLTVLRPKLFCGAILPRFLMPLRPTRWCWAVLTSRYCVRPWRLRYRPMSTLSTVPKPPHRRWPALQRAMPVRAACA